MSGACIAGLYVVTETWLNGAATNRTRGSLFAIYMAVVGGALLGGQVLFSFTDPSGFVAFVLASVLVSLAVVPVSLVDVSAPATPDPTPLSMRALVATAPLAAVGAALSGFTGAAMIGAGVVYAAASGFDNPATAAFVGATLAGGLLLQILLGSWSDRTDRRLVIAASALVAAIVAAALSTVDSDRRLVIIALTTIAGGVTFPLYSLCNAHLNDYLDSELVVAGGARMALVNGVGAVAGPIVGAFAIQRFGPGASSWWWRSATSSSACTRSTAPSAGRRWRTTSGHPSSRRRWASVPPRPSRTPTSTRPTRSWRGGRGRRPGGPVPGAGGRRAGGGRGRAERPARALG